MKSRNTKQKELILEVLKNTKTHPTIYELTNMISSKDSTIGQATIYRNIKKFVKDGVIYVVKTQNGLDRYDYYNNHIHFECLNCGSISDIYDEKIFALLHKKFQNKNLNIQTYNINLDGYCKTCEKILTRVDNDN